MKLIFFFISNNSYLLCKLDIFLFVCTALSAVFLCILQFRLDRHSLLSKCCLTNFIIHHCCSFNYESHAAPDTSTESALANTLCVMS